MFDGVMTSMLRSFVLLSVLVGAGGALAHNNSRAAASFRVDDRGQIAITYDLVEADLLDVADVDLSNPAEEAQLSPALQKRFPSWARFVGDGKNCPAHFTSWQRKGVRGVRILGQARCDRLPGQLTVHWGLSKLASLDLMVIATVIAPGDVTHAAVLSKRATKLSVTLARPSTWETLSTFIASGVEHIWLGWDHLSFLLALLLGCATLRRVALVVTGFTVAHSITLALGALGVLSLSSRVVEPIIAASIAAAALMGAPG